MPNYIFNDEDNEPMIDPVENLHHVTGYLSFSEMRAVESGVYFAHIDERKEAEHQKKHGNFDALLDELKLTGKCRECPNVVELIEGFMDKNGLISNEQFMYLEHVCVMCGAKDTGTPSELHQKFIDHDWNDRLEWAKANLPRMSCAWCPNAFRVYGEYKDPDDEWDAIEKLCGNCKYFQEAD